MRLSVAAWSGFVSAVGDARGLVPEKEIWGIAFYLLILIKINKSRRSGHERIAAILGPACGLPMFIQFFRPRATGRIEFSARLLLSLCPPPAPFGLPPPPWLGLPGESYTIELRHAPWIGWIHDLSRSDPYYILPAIMAVSMYFMQKMTP